VNGFLIQGANISVTFTKAELAAWEMFWSEVDRRLRDEDACTIPRRAIRDRAGRDGKRGYHPLPLIRTGRRHERAEERQPGV
jgi:hypothetical protein